VRSDWLQWRLRVVHEQQLESQPRVLLLKWMKFGQLIHLYVNLRKYLQGPGPCQIYVYTETKRWRGSWLGTAPGNKIEWAT
jgi:hypothetical protein